MHRIYFFKTAALALVIACSGARAQSSVNSVRVFTEPAGLVFTVDGQNLSSAQDFFWPATSKHVVTSFDQVGLKTKYVLVGATTNLGGSVGALLPVTADPGLKWIKLTFVTSYAVTVSVFDCSGYPEKSCPSAGIVVLGGLRIDRDTEVYMEAGSIVVAEAYPAAGYIFTGWGPLSNQPAPVPSTQFVIKFVVNEPQHLTPRFWPANAVTTQIDILTDPPSLQVLADRTPLTVPVHLEWGWGTVHAIGTAPVQYDRGVPYVFDSWSDGGAINHDIQVPSQAGALTFTAHFIPGSPIAFVTSPPGLTLTVDGRQNWPAYNFIWGVNTVHSILAPATQTDAQGRKYKFISWSNGKSPAFDYTVAAMPGDDRVTAVYEALGQATITSTPPGISVQVDGANCTTPCSIERTAGASAAVTVPAVRNLTASSRLVFSGWGDSSDTTRVIAVSPEPKTYTANFHSQSRLSLAATPVEGATFQISPSSPDGFYDGDSQVTIVARMALGFRIASWSGDIAGKSSTSMVMLDAPKSAILMLDRVPAIAPAGVRNAAMEALPDSVAPGSIISIFGGNLAPASQIGPANPLAQTLQNVTVRVEDTFLPLFFVSPEQINAQISSAIPEGMHKITVRWEGKPEITAQIAVTRNAPGLFSTGPPDRSVGSFVRANGEAVTPDNPARAGEIVTAFGTGLGPYATAPPDGFLFDESSAYTLVDAVTVVAGDGRNLDALYAGRSAAGVGVDAVRFQLPDALPDSSFLTVKIRINGQESNAVLLPVSH